MGSHIFPILFVFEIWIIRISVSLSQEGKVTWTVADAVDYKGFPVDKSTTGGWIRAAQILGLFLFSISHVV